METGDRVVYNDEYLGGDPADVTGTIVEPTEDERRTVREFGDAVGPDYGDVLVSWDDGERYWEQPSDLVKVKP